MQSEACVAKGMQQAQSYRCQKIIDCFVQERAQVTNNAEEAAGIVPDQTAVHHRHGNSQQEIGSSFAQAYLGQLIYETTSSIASSTAACSKAETVRHRKGLSSSIQHAWPSAGDQVAHV